MYRITKEIALYLIDNSKDFDIPGIDKDQDKPFVIRNLNSIGSVNPFLIIGSYCKYIVETDAPEMVMEHPEHTEVSGFWLYKQSELKKPDDLVEMPRASIDHYTTDLEAQFDVTDCIVELPSPVDKLTCVSIKTFERLFELEPELKDCLDSRKEEMYGGL